MKKILSVLLTAVMLCSVLCIFTPVETKVDAAYYNTYTDLKAVLNAESCGSMQGMAVGDTYIYTIKRNDTDTGCVIHKTARVSANQVLLTNSSGGATVISGLGHANDACYAKLNGVDNMFVVTMTSAANNLYQISLSGDYYTVKAKYSIKVNGSYKAMSGIDIISYDDSKINFLFKSNKYFYKGSLTVGAATGTVINATDAFTIDLTSAYFNGTKTDVSGYTHQGYGYYNDMLFVPLTKSPDVSVIVVYSGVSLASGTIKPKTDLSFRITSSTYATLFEMESVGIGPDGKLYFNTNRRKSSTSTNHDAISYFNDFNMSSLAINNHAITAPSEVEVNKTASVSWTAPAHVIKYNYKAVLNNNGVTSTLVSKSGSTDTSFTVPAVSAGTSITVTVDAIGPYNTYTTTKVINIKTLVPSDITPSDTEIVKDLSGEGYFKGFESNTTVSETLSKFAQDSAYLQIRNNTGVVLSDSELVGTGYTVNIVDGGNVIKSYTLVVTGDCNSDGAVTASDYILQCSHLNGSAVMEGAFVLAADVNGDGSVSAADYGQTVALLKGF